MLVICGKTGVHLLTSNVTCESWYVIRTLLRPELRALAGSLIPQAADVQPHSGKRPPNGGGSCLAGFDR